MPAKVVRYVRILPMATGEFHGSSIKEVQDDFFLRRLPFERKGDYHFHEQGLAAPQGTIVLFQYDNQIIAAARFVKQHSDSRLPKGYRGVLLFEPGSIRTFDPISHAQIQRIWPNVGTFGRLKWKLNASKFVRLETLLKGIRSSDELDSEEAADNLDESDPYTSDGIDRREVAIRQVRQRRGQTKFRNALRKLYGDCCQVTGCQILDLIEAAHISPYRGDPDHSPQNGVLLRADIHTLFDLDLVGIEPDGLTIHLHPKVQAEYSNVVGKVLLCKSGNRPSTIELQKRFIKFKEKLSKQ